MEQYRRRARFYDFQLALAEPVRRRAIERLGLKRGDTVLDVGCGTGLSFELLEQRIGHDAGKIVGIEQSSDMIEQARARAERNRFENVTLITSPVEEAEIPVLADAALFHFTHDILRTPAAVANVIRHLKPGARVVATGLKWARPWALPTNLMVLQAALFSVTSLEGLAAAVEQPRAMGPHRRYRDDARARRVHRYRNRGRRSSRYHSKHSSEANLICRHPRGTSFPILRRA